jgi:uncharacterized membrane protein
VTAKPDAQTVLSSVPFSVRRTDGDYHFIQGRQSPLLVVGRHGRGRTAALATDVAPHWVGGFVDWGDARMIQKVGGELFEVGNWYSRFFGNLLQWTANLL